MEFGGCLCIILLFRMAMIPGSWLMHRFAQAISRCPRTCTAKEEEAKYPQVDTRRFNASANRFKQVMSQASKFIGSLTASDDFARRFMERRLSAEPTGSRTARPLNRCDD